VAGEGEGGHLAARRREGGPVGQKQPLPLAGKGYWALHYYLHTKNGCMVKMSSVREEINL